MNRYSLLSSLFLFLAILGSSNLLSAQDAPTEDPVLQRAEAVVVRLTERFKLSETQQAVLLEKQIELQNELALLRESDLGQEERQAAFTELNKQRRSMLDEVLTEEQKATLPEGNRQMRRDQMPADRMPVPAGTPAEKSE